jgi:predicted restriction endonuclease
LTQAPGEDEAFNGYGAVPGVTVGRTFLRRRPLSEAKVHRPTQAGICGTKDHGAESIVVSGGYKDDEDFGNVIIYTGHGGRDSATGRQIKDQDLNDSGNAALVVSRMNNRPVRVIRGAGGDPKYSPDEGYRYDGLYVVEDHWSKIGLDGFLIWQFRLQHLEQDVASNVASQEAAELPMPDGEPTPRRHERISQAIARSRDVADRVKRAHEHVCQVCGIVLETPGGLRYAETAHVRGLGRPHNGPDETDNALCLCPNHHKLFDLGGITIDKTLRVIDETTGMVIGQLRLRRGHHINPEHLRYHRELYRQNRPDEDR